jgi:uncharacterized protein HemX
VFSRKAPALRGFSLFFIFLPHASLLYTFGMDTATSTPSVDTSVDTSSTPPDNNTPIPVFDPAPVADHRVGSTGSVIAILLIVLLLIVGAFYVWGQRLSENRALQLNTVQ